MLLVPERHDDILEDSMLIWKTYNWYLYQSMFYSRHISVGSVYSISTMQPTKSYAPQ